jgi:hypothetical protein
MIEGYESAIVAAIVGLLVVIAGLFAAAVEFVASEDYEKEKKR